MDTIKRVIAEIWKLPERSQELIHLRVLIRAYFYGALATLGTLFLAHIFAPKHQYDFYQAANDIVIPILVWLWARPLISTVYYSLLYRVPVRGLLADVNLTWVATYGVAAGVAAYFSLQHWAPVHRLAVHYHAMPIQLWTIVSVAGIALALAARSVYFSFVPNTVGPPLHAIPLPPPGYVPPISKIPKMQESPDEPTQWSDSTTYVPLRVPKFD